MQYHPKADDCERVLIVNHERKGMNYNRFRRRVMPVVHELARVIDEIQPWRRWDPMNHAAHFPSHFTEIYDSFPVRVCEPDDSELAGVLRQPKYNVTAAYCHFGRDPFQEGELKFFAWEDAKDLSKYTKMTGAAITKELASQKTEVLTKWVD